MQRQQPPEKHVCACGAVPVRGCRGHRGAQELRPSQGDFVHDPATDGPEERHRILDHQVRGLPQVNDQQDGSWTLKVKHTTTTFEDEEPDSASAVLKKPEEEDGVVMIYEEKPEEQDNHVDPKDLIKAYEEEEEEEKEEREVLQPMALRFEGDPPEEDTEPPALEMTSEEKEHYHMKEERKQIMERFPRSRGLDLVSMGYSLFPDVGWLKLNTAHWQWDVARKSCQTEGAHLAVPDTLPKIKAFTKILKENTDVIGRAVLKNQVFVGEPFIPESVSIWFPNEPNDAAPGEDCVTLHVEGQLRDVPCFFNLPFICQIDLSDASVIDTNIPSQLSKPLCNTKMSTCLASVLFLVVMVVAADGDAKRRHKEASTTFLRLTALRSDEGLWTARFVDYELHDSFTPSRMTFGTVLALTGFVSCAQINICSQHYGIKIVVAISIELKHHPNARGDGECNDTWSLKLKHAPKRFIIPEEKPEPTGNEVDREITHEPSFQTSETRETWKQIVDSLDDNDEDDTPVFKKAHVPKKKRAKTRRQLSTKTFTSTTEKNDVNLGETAGAYTNEPVVLSELVQGLSDSFALPLKQSSQTRYYDNMLDQDTATPVNYNPDTWQVPEDVTVEEVSEQSSTNTSEETQSTDNLEPGISFGNDIVQPQNSSADSLEVPEDVTVENNNEQPTREDSQEVLNKGQAEDYETDYVIEDTLTGDDDDDDENVGIEAESTEVDFSELEVPPEMKRIMEWYPRSKPLSTLNNGYKLFPGVGWFKFVPWAERWSNAKKVCKSEKAHLAIPDSKEKVRIFLQIFRNFPDVLEQNKLFQPRFPVWFPGEPDNADPGEDCVTFHAEGKIRDVPCFYNLPFLCEKEPDIS
ncbi:hypothetical protein C0J52_18408 [Blattella germanica]|nr:hypothetical protein C0J52_18408 [Blattella germanica]